MCSRCATLRLQRGRRAQLAWTVWACALSVICPSTFAAQEPAAAEGALAFFAGLPPGDVSDALGSRRPSPISVDDRNRAIANLPPGVLRPVAGESVMLATLRPILVFHDRTAIVDVEIIDIDQAFVGLHARSIVLISRRALQLVSATELQALVAHEIGHEYFWNEYQRATKRNDRRALKDVELKCDGVAALTLAELGLNPRVLTSATLKLTRFNEKLSATADSTSYPSPPERERFVLAVLALRAQPAVSR
jgi:hypothetical protein